MRWWDMNQLKLDGSISSSEDLRAVIEEIKSYKSAFRQAQIKAAVSHHPGRQPLPELSSPAAAMLNQFRSGSKPIINETIEQALVELERMFAQAVKIRVVLAAPAPNSLKRRLTDWMRNNVAKNLLIDYRYDSGILGGMVIIAGSHIYDWSLRRDLQANGDKFKEVISRV
ncbi:F0F1 ATP synthase subunit delta [Patescibacteria group bacterium]|nr:F0F1 ATP synthase subunit delta [Patescibacteria group bacterium]